jgi:N-acyl-D-aspartate/D-glutamate deacylase
VLDWLIKAGTIVDGTGRPAARGDVGVRDGRIVAVGQVEEPAAGTIDATGLVVAPGFVDIHTHYDAQIFWDPSLSPSPLHGVTTVVAGNCGFTIAPLDPEHADYIMSMLAVVEGMPLESLRAGVPWGSWRTVGDYLDALPTPVINAGFLAGHSTVRRAVMGADAHDPHPSEKQMTAMEAILRESLAAGALGFSSSNGVAHADAQGDPVPSKSAGDEELFRLARVVRDFPGTTLEYIPTSPVAESARMAGMSVQACRPLNWNVLSVSADREATVERALSASDPALARGGEVVALTNPAPIRVHRNLLSGFGFNALPGWGPTFQLAPAERAQALADPSVRRHLREGLASASPAQSHMVDQSRWVIEAVVSDANLALVGRTVAEVARDRGIDAFDAFLDVAVADSLATTFAPPEMGGDEASWRLRAKVWQDPRVVLGASDAGAHVDMLSAFTYTTELLGAAVRDRELLSIEAAVRLLSDVPACLYGLTGRGRIELGAHADLVVFEPDRVGPGTVGMRTDLPAGAPRLFAGGEGMVAVLVGGVPVVEQGRYTGAVPGSVLRSGRDTKTVEPGTR